MTVECCIGLCWKCDFGSSQELEPWSKILIWASHTMKIDNKNRSSWSQVVNIEGLKPSPGESIPRPPTWLPPPLLGRVTHLQNSIFFSVGKSKTDLDLHHTITPWLKNVKIKIINNNNNYNNIYLSQHVVLHDLIYFNQIHYRITFYIMRERESC